MVGGRVYSIFTIHHVPHHKVESTRVKEQLMSTVVLLLYYKNYFKDGNELLVLKYGHKACLTLAISYIAKSLR